jgi:hypothetical protein
MNLKYTSFFIIALVLLGFQSCKEQCEEYFLGDLIYTNPYQGSETLIYYKSDGDSLIFKGQGRYNSVTKASRNNECYEIELDDCYFDDIHEKYKLVIRLRPATDHGVAEISLDVQDYFYSDRWHFNSKSYFNLPLSADNMKPDQEYFDSLLILNQYYYDVYVGSTILDRTPTTKENMADTIHPSFIYYNIELGIVKIDFDDGSTWELKEILN